MGAAVDKGEAVAAWPPLPWDEWKETCETLHMWTQVVGKVKLELTPFLNEWWEVAFHVTPRGLTTGLIPCGDRAFAVDFDFTTHNLFVRTSDDRTKALALLPRSVADFYREFMAALHALGIEVAINTTPVEVPHPIPFDQDHQHAAYDPAPVHRWWRILVLTTEVLQRFRSSFVGKSSPINFFWGSFDLSETRFSGKPATPPQGPRFYQLGEDQENFACGFWPGNPTAAGVTLGAPAFYAYIYPEPAGFKEATIQPAAASYDPKLGEFILPYEDARRAPSPAQAILDFFQSSYAAAAALAGWDRATLERPVPPVGASRAA